VGGLFNINSDKLINISDLHFTPLKNFVKPLEVYVCLLAFGGEQQFKALERYSHEAIEPLSTEMRALRKLGCRLYQVRLALP